MATYPPFMNASGTISRILNRIKEAKTPERFTQDFLATELGVPGGSARPFIPLAKRLGFLTTDGTPTELYRRFRNQAQSAAAMAEAMRRGYETLYKRNEYVHRLDRTKLRGLVAEATGLETQSPNLRAIVSTFEALKTFADFEGGAADDGVDGGVEHRDVESDADVGARRRSSALQLSYTFYLNLPNTSDIAVFDAIFRSLRKNLLD